MKRPSFQFYPGDWLRDTALRSCSVGARGLWIDMISFMHEGKPYGHLKVNNKVIDKVSLARMVGGHLQEISDYIVELTETGVLSADENGTFFSRRMVKDELLRETRAAGGSLGGNPSLGVEYNISGFVYLMKSDRDCYKIGISQHPDKRAYKVRKATGDQSIKVVAKRWVSDMGAEEKQLHKEYESYQIDGEWFEFPDSVLEALMNGYFHLKENPKKKVKERQTPSSSSSSPSSSSSSFSSPNKEKGVEPLELKLEEDVQFPANLDTIPFRLAWQSYMAYRKTGRMKPLQPASIAAQLKKLSEWGHDIAIAAINETIANAWQGIFFPKTGPAGTIVRPVFTRQRAASSL